MIERNPRSTLHCLIPYGQGTGLTESLTSFFCRLAQSHGTSSRDLAAWIMKRKNQEIPENFKWFRRAFSGASESTENWATWLADLTGTPSLDRLTLTPWRHLVAESCLTSRTDRWCPACLKHDRDQGHDTHLRLIWDIDAVKACPVHKVELIGTCQHCGKSNTRHRSSTVLPGYCTSCGGFLGDHSPPRATPTMLWTANQVGQMLAHEPKVNPDALAELLHEIILTQTGGDIAAFAREIGKAKSTVWNWIKGHGKPTLQTWLVICLHTTRQLSDIFSGNLDVTSSKSGKKQLPLPLLEVSPRKGIRSRVIDWDQIRKQLESFLTLEEPITLAQACERVNIDQKLIYQNANQQARALSERFLKARDAIRQEKTHALRQHLANFYGDRVNEGRSGLSAREAWKTIPKQLLSVRNVFQHIKQATAANDN